MRQCTSRHFSVDARAELSSRRVVLHAYASRAASGGTWPNSLRCVCAKRDSAKNMPRRLAFNASTGAGQPHVRSSCCASRMRPAFRVCGVATWFGGRHRRRCATSGRVLSRPRCVASCIQSSALGTVPRPRSQRSWKARGLRRHYRDVRFSSNPRHTAMSFASCLSRAPPCRSSSASSDRAIAASHIWSSSTPSWAF